MPSQGTTAAKTDSGVPSAWPRREEAKVDGNRSSLRKYKVASIGQTDGLRNQVLFDNRSLKHSHQLMLIHY